MEESAFAAFYEFTYRKLRAYVMKGVGEAAVADDITQEAYVRLLQVVKRGSETPQAKAYLYRIATNLMRDHWRRSRREVRDDDAEVERVQRTDDSRMDFSLDVNQAFGHLAPNQRTLLWLAYVEGYAHRDIARVMNIGERSVRVLLYRARSRLLAVLRRMGIEAEDA
ncbi:MAG TPA: RNA polymerase sigma factor [Candidatus Krumholzibacteria bacterium]|nr:RNA polymerase sigma factor [Candidatus Krumholzibacteria bacterium]